MQVLVKYAPFSVAYLVNTETNFNAEILTTKDMLKKIDHLGIAVHSIAVARKFYEDILGLTCEKEEEVASQKVRTAFL